MPTFGADPDAEDMGWTEAPTRNHHYVSRPVRELTNYFAYHRHMSMSQKCDEDDKSMLNMFFSRELKRGHSAPNLKIIIDRFFQHPASQTQFPAFMFCKNDVQAELSDDIKREYSDPVLQWLVDGMPNTAEQIADPPKARKAILLYCDESLYRYPDLVATIVRYAEDPSEMLNALELLIQWNIGDNDEDAGHLRSVLSKITLPKELASVGRSPKSMRRKRDDVEQAVASIPVRRNKEKW
jgi:hypothetical protein